VRRLQASGARHADFRAKRSAIGRVQLSRWRDRYAESRIEGIEQDLPRGAPLVKIDVARVIGQCQQRHTHSEWLKFLRKIDRETPKDKALHLIADNYATHKHPAVQEWLAKHPRFNMHFTPTSASWLNRVERFFCDITTERLRRGAFTSVPELVAAINKYVAHHSKEPKPFIWTESARDILQKVIRANSRLSSKQNATLH
jgi:transposase